MSDEVKETAAVKPTVANLASRPGRKRILLWSGVAVLLIAVAAAVVLPLYLTLQPAYYDRYPSLAPRIASWRTSTHSTVPCADCHVDPGANGMLAFAGKAIPAFYSQLVQGPRAANLLSTPSTAACLRCHIASRTISPNGDLLIPHAVHVEKLGIRCAVCHKNLVHSPNSKGFNTPEMATCLVAGCHDGKKTANTCVTCHTQKEVPANHKQPDWLDVQSDFVGTIDCAQCHAWTPDYCAVCHAQRPPSHVGNWKQLHGLRAQARGTKGCLVCHDQKKFCNKCH